MNEHEEQAYLRGQEQARMSMLSDILRSMRGNESMEAQCGRLLAENSATKEALRQAFDELELPYFNPEMGMADIVRTLKRLVVKEGG